MRNASDETNAELLDRARRGEGRAFEDLARAVERPLYRHALRMLANASDAEDVVQDALLSAWKSLSSFEGASFRAWIFRITTNRALDRLRARKRRPELPLDPPADDEEAGWAEPAASSANVRPDLLQEGSIGEPHGRQAPWHDAQRRRCARRGMLRDVEGFAYEEIATITVAEIGTVKSRIHRGRLAVRNALVAKGWKGSAG